MSDKRFHVELNSIDVEGMKAKFNIFGDTLESVTSDLEAVIAYVTGTKLPDPVKPVAPVPAAATQSNKPPRLPVPRADQVCFKCGGPVELIRWEDKETGLEWAGWRCQAQGCKKWQPARK